MGWYGGISGGGGGGMAIGGAVAGGTDLSVLFIHPVGVLAQDNPHFIYDPATNYLRLGTNTDTGIYYLNNVPGLYQVRNASGNNWFEGNAGNLSLTGYSNFGTGDGCLSFATTGYSNTAVGVNALQHITDGFENFAFGSRAMQSSTSDSYNTAVGTHVLGQIGSGGANAGNNTQNTALGYNALGNATTAYGNTVLGFGSLANVSPPTIAYDNTIIGKNAGGNLGVSAGASIHNDIFLGADCGSQITGGISNTWIGSYIGTGASYNNTIVLTEGSSMLDWNVAVHAQWSMGTAFGFPATLNLFNKQSSIGVPGNYEVATLDWQTTSNVFRISTTAGGSGMAVRLIAIDGFSKAGAPAAGDMPSGSYAVIDDTTNNQTWLCFNKAGTIRKVQLT